MAGVVLFLHGLQGNKDSWGGVPDYVRKSGFEIDRIEYDAKLTSAANCEVSARQVITKLQTSYEKYDPIYLVGYSLGGLISREVCRKLLVGGPDEVLNRIGGVVTVGTPLEGARGLLNPVIRWVPWLSPKLAEIAAKKQFSSYRHAINEATKRNRNVRRPRHFHVEIESDKVIARQLADQFTEDDVEAAVIPGSHRNFASDNKSASHVAEVIVSQIRNGQNAASRPNIPKTESVRAVLPDRLILIACSHTKASGGDSLVETNPAAWIKPPNLRQRVINKRSYIYSVLNDAKLADGFERGGNRKHQQANIELKHGPDLGGVPVVGNEAKYLHASERYRGRFYAALSPDAWSNYHIAHADIGVLIMSGLYGLLEVDELIQNYDVHLTDTHIESGQSVSSMWQDLYVEMLNDYIRSACRGRKVKIVNLLCDQHYVDAVTWHNLSTDCVVYHIASPTLSDVELLPAAGCIFDALLREPGRLEHLQRDTPIELSSFGTPPPGLSDTRIIFESRVGGSRE